MIKKLNGWIDIQYGFAKKRNETTFDVIRVNNIDELVYVEFYDKVDISKIKPTNFKLYGSYVEYAEQKTDYEKAMYAAVFSLQYDDYRTCYNENEVKTLLVEEKVLSEEEVFDLSNY